MTQQKKNERAMSITFHFLRGLKKVLLHTYVVAGRRLLKNTVPPGDLSPRRQISRLNSKVMSVQIQKFENNMKKYKTTSNTRPPLLQDHGKTLR